MPRLRAKPTISLGGSPAVGGRWDPVADAPAPLEARSDRETAVAVYAAGQEVGRVTFVPWRRHAGGGWHWVITASGALQDGRRSGYAGSREGALDALARSWGESRAR